MLMKTDVNYMHVRSSDFNFKKHAIELYMTVRRFFSPEDSVQIVQQFLVKRIDELMDREGAADVSEISDHPGIQSFIDLFNKPYGYWEQVRSSKIGNLKRIS